MRSLVHKKMFGLIWQMVLAMDTLILPKEIGYLFLVWMNSMKSRKYSWYFSKQVITELLLAYSFPKIYMVYSWLKLKAHSRDIFFPWTFELLLNKSSWCFFIWRLISYYIEETLYVNTYSKWWKRNTFSRVSCIDVEQSFF